jgi:hypothetical protein
MKILEGIEELKNNYTVLIFDHNAGGGGHYYIDYEITKRIQEYQTVYLIRYDINISKYLITSFGKKGNIDFKDYESVDCFKLISKIKFDEIFINSLVTYPWVSKIIDFVIQFHEKNQNCKIIVPIHDYFVICPRYNLLNYNNEYCFIPEDTTICRKCLRNTDIDVWREKWWRKVLEKSNQILCFSNSSKNIFLKVYPDLLNKIIVIPHDTREKFKNIYIPKKNKEIRIGILGNILASKGGNIIKELVEYIDKYKINAKVIIIGTFPYTIESNSLEVTGTYERSNLESIVISKNISRFLIPSICPETFSYTTEEVMQMGYPIFVFNLGAQAERVSNYSLGTVMEINDLYEQIFKI